MDDQPRSPFYVYAIGSGNDINFRTTALDVDDYKRPDVRAAWRVDGALSMSHALGVVLLYHADQYLGSDITITRLIPREPTNEEKLEAARRILRADYWDDVRSVVADIKDEIEKGELTTEDQVTEYLDERIDSQHRIIYTYAAMETVLFSDNDGAYEQEFGSEGMAEDGVIQWGRLAYYAMRADVLDTLGDVDEMLAENAKTCADCDKPFAEDDDTEIDDYRGEKRKVHVVCPEEDDDDDE